MTSLIEGLLTGRLIMKKLKLFIENLLVYGVGGVISKIIPLIMVPIVTKLMPSSEYFGISDLSGTVVSFGSAIAVMGMYDAMYRLFFENESIKYKKTVCSTTIVFTFFNSIIIFVLLVLCRKLIAQLFFHNQQYAYVIYISALAVLVSSTNTIVSAPTRMQNQRRIYLIANTVSPIISYTIAIILLLKGHYVLALPIGLVVAGASMETMFLLLNHKWFNPKLFDRTILKQLLVLGAPLLPNFLIYWIFNSSDKLMITNYLGIGLAGIYAVGAKLGHTSQLIYTAFAGGWQFFAFSTMNEKNQVKNNSDIFEYLGAISFIATAYICAISSWFFKTIFSEEYYGGYIVAPYLFLGPLLLMLYQVIGNQFLITKKTWPSSAILAAGAIINVVLNWLLIPRYGIEGAAIATLLGYIVSVCVCVLVQLKLQLMILSNRSVLIAILMMCYMLLWRFFFSSNTIVGLVSATIFFSAFVFLYKNELSSLIKMVKVRRMD